MGTNYRNSKTSKLSDDENLDNLNQSMAENLSMKVGKLKTLALDLEGESKDQIPLLEDMGDNMDNSSYRLGGTSGRLRNLGRTRGMSSRKLSCLIGLTITTVMVIIYYILLPLTATRSSSNNNST